MTADVIAVVLVLVAPALLFLGWLTLIGSIAACQAGTESSPRLTTRKCTAHAA